MAKQAQNGDRVPDATDETGGGATGETGGGATGETGGGATGETGGGATGETGGGATGETGGDATGETGGEATGETGATKGIEVGEQTIRVRAYEISQGQDSESPEENWRRAIAQLRAEREQPPQPATRTSR